VRLSGADGNAFAVMANCKDAWRKAKKPMDGWVAIQKDMMSGDYDHLLQVAIANFEVY
jgi:hypothetical protein